MTTRAGSDAGQCVSMRTTAPPRCGLLPAVRLVPLFAGRVTEGILPNTPFSPEMFPRKKPEELTSKDTARVPGDGGPTPRIRVNGTAILESKALAIIKGAGFSAEHSISSAGGDHGGAQGEIQLIEQKQQVVEVHGLDEVGIEPGFLRTLPIRILSVPCHGDQGHASSVPALRGIGGPPRSHP